MESINLNTLQSLKPATYEKKNFTPAEAQQNFADSLKIAIEKVNNNEVNASQATDNLINGKLDNLHDVMIAAQKASITRTAAVEVRNKVIDAYKEIMRMQM